MLRSLTNADEASDIADSWSSPLGFPSASRATPGDVEAAVISDAFNMAVLTDAKCPLA
jgi:hypothetical protein